MRPHLGHDHVPPWDALALGLDDGVQEVQVLHGRPQAWPAGARRLQDGLPTSEQSW